MENSLPIVVHTFSHNYLFGFVSVNYKIEDRRPDLKDYDGKYKNWIRVRIGWVTLTWTYRTNYLYNEQPYNF